MSASVSVGFSPSTTSLVSLPGGGGAAPDDGAAGDGGLFAALLGLVGEQIAPALSDAAEQLPQVGADLGALIDTLAPADAAAGLVEPGKSALKSLGDALTSVADSLEAAKPLDPAQEKRLREALDAVGLYLGGLPAALAGAAPQPETAGAAPVDATVDRLAGLVAQVGQSLREANPGLAGQLDALATKLRSGGVTADALADLGLSDDVDSDIEKLLAAFSAPRPATKAAEPQQLATPQLPAPVTDSADAAHAAPETAPSLRVEAAPVAKPQVSAAPAPVDPTPQPAARPDDAPEPAPDAPDATATTAAQATNAAAPTTAPSGVAGATRVAHAAYQSPVQQINFPQVAFEVVRQMGAGSSRFQIRLDPPELGRIDVKLDMDKHGTVNARMVVERPETLDLMQRDQRALQQALNQAGLDASRTNLEFSLRQNPFGHGQSGAGQGQSGGYGAGLAGGEDDAAEIATQVTTLYRGTASAGGVNLFV